MGRLAGRCGVPQLRLKPELAHFVRAQHRARTRRVRGLASVASCYFNELMEVLPTPDPDVAFQRLEDEIVLVHLKTNQIFALNVTGARFWELLAEGKPRAEIETTMLSEFDVTREQLNAEIARLLDALAAERLVRA